MKTPVAYLRAISYYTPDSILGNGELATLFPGWTVEKVAEKVGISNRHIVEEGECASDLAVKAAEKLFIEHSIDSTSIDFILLCTQSPDYFLPTTACVLQDRLKLPTTAGALDFNLGCSGFVYGLALAKGLVVSGIAKNILLITAETYSRHIHPRDRSNRTIFGDAATASLVSVSGFASIEDFSLGTDGSGAGNLIVKTGGFRNRKEAKDLSFDELGNPVSSDYLFMDGPEILSFTLGAVPEIVKKTLQMNKLLKEDVDLFVFHQANKYILEILRKKIGIDESKFYYCIENFGNTVSSTIPIALAAAHHEGRLQGNVMLVGFGVGYSWGGCVLKVKN